MAGGLKIHHLVMAEESEPEISSHKSVVRSSNHPDQTTLCAQLISAQYKNLIHSSKRIRGKVLIAHNQRFSMVMKALRVLVPKSGAADVEYFKFGSLRFKPMSSSVNVDLVRH